MSSPSLLSHAPLVFGCLRSPRETPICSATGTENYLLRRPGLILTWVITGYESVTRSAKASLEGGLRGLIRDGTQVMRPGGNEEDHKLAYRRGIPGTFHSISPQAFYMT